MGTSSVYDEIGRSYTVTRRPDPRIARAIDTALGDASSVVNVGAGAGSYEPSHLRVTAVEPSPAMIRQRAPGAAPVVQAVAEHLPFADASFDAALAVLTLHHWTDRAGGLAELARVARRRVVILTWDPSCRDLFWLTTEYLPAISTSTSRASRSCRTSLGASRRWTHIRYSCLTIAWTAFSEPSGAGPTPISIPGCAGAYPASPSSPRARSTRASPGSPRTSTKAAGTPGSATCAPRTMRTSATGSSSQTQA